MLWLLTACWEKAPGLGGASCPWASSEPQVEPTFCSPGPGGSHLRTKTLLFLRESPELECVQGLLE